jgi:hypothetical protein
MTFKKNQLFPKSKSKLILKSNRSILLSNLLSIYKNINDNLKILKQKKKEKIYSFIKLFI